MVEPNLKIMVYCAADPISPFTRADIAFPYQVEVRVNGDEVKANLRGLKNKPGSTRPADITNLVRKRAGYENMMIVTYALTQKVSNSDLINCKPMVVEAIRLLFPSQYSNTDNFLRNFILLSTWSGSTRLKSLSQGSRQGRSSPRNRSFARVSGACP